MTILTNAARAAALTMCGYISGTGLIVSAEDADDAAKRLFEELDKLQTIISALIRARVGSVVFGFVLGAVLVLQAVIVGYGGHP